MAVPIGACALSGDELGFAVAGCCAVVMALASGLPVRPFKLLLPIVLILALSVVVTFFGPVAGEELTAIRGTYYFLRPIVFIVAGYLLARIDWSDGEVMWALILIGGLASVGYLNKYLSDPSVFFQTRSYIRLNIGAGSLATWLVPCCAFLLWKQSSAVSRLALIAVTVISIAAIYASTSRTGYLAVGLFAAVVTLKAGHRRMIAPVCVVFLIAAFFATTPFGDWVLGQGQLSALLPDMLAELAPPTDGGAAAINNQWRGFEAARAFDFVVNQSPLAALVGTGLSSQVPLGLSISLAGEERQSVDVFHSAFSQLFVRAGLLGVIAYFLFVYRATAAILRPAILTPTAQVGSAAFLVLIVGTPTIGGLFNAGSSGALGLLLAGIALQRSGIATDGDSKAEILGTNLRVEDTLTTTVLSPR